MTSDVPMAGMEPQQTRVEARRARRLVGYLMLLTVVTALLSAGTSIVYTKRTAINTEHKAREDIQRWCALLTSLDERQQKIQNPPPDQKVFIDQIHDLWLAYDCKAVS